MSKKIERRLFAEPIEVRKSADGKVGVRGYAAVFDYEAHGEVIRRSAFNRTISQRDNVRLLVNHDGVPLASTKAGTLVIGVDERGLWFEASELDMDNPTARELVSAMERGDMDQCSFAGYFLDAQRNSDGTREVREVALLDVSVVTFPWYDATEADLTGDRDLDRALVSARSLNDEQRQALLAELSDEATEPVVEDPAPVEEPPARTYSVAEARALLGN